MAAVLGVLLRHCLLPSPADRASAWSLTCCSVACGVFSVVCRFRLFALHPPCVRVHCIAASLHYLGAVGSVCPAVFFLVVSRVWFVVTAACKHCFCVCMAALLLVCLAAAPLPPLPSPHPQPVLLVSWFVPVCGALAFVSGVLLFAPFSPFATCLPATLASLHLWRCSCACCRSTQPPLPPVYGPVGAMAPPPFVVAIVARPMHLSSIGLRPLRFVSGHSIRVGVLDVELDMLLAILQAASLPWAQWPLICFSITQPSGVASLPASRYFIWGLLNIPHGVHHVLAGALT